MKLDELPFKQVDVFTEIPFMGNPVAVILEADHLSTNQMQAIANWTNLSETTFVCKPSSEEADYRLRIFTPRMELPFAGHPTLGSAWALMESGLTTKAPGFLVQECEKGPITLRAENGRLFFELPEPAFLETAELVPAAIAALGIGDDHIKLASLVEVGPVWLTLQLPTVASVLALRPDMGQLSRLEEAVGITVFALGEHGEIEVRSFAPAAGVPEDPVCGSGNGSVAALIRRHHLLPATSYMAFQGRCVGRDGRVEVRFENDRIWLGGSAVTCVEGRMKTKPSSSAEALKERHT